MPYADLGLIVVDEEHDQAYKQDDGAHYHARDMAVVRAHIARIPIVLASATPSVESEVNARKGRYQRVALPSRFGGQHMSLSGFGECLPDKRNKVEINKNLTDKWGIPAMHITADWYENDQTMAGLKREACLCT